MTDSEINEAVAKKLGWTITGNCGGLKAYRNFKETEFSEQEYIPDYVHSIEAAWEIVEFLGRERHVRIGWQPLTKMWYVRFNEDSNDSGNSDTAPRAICEAFLRLP